MSRAAALGHEFFLHVLEYDEQWRNDEQQGYRTDEHSAYRTYTDRNVAVGTYTAGEHHWEHTENHGERCHQDGA